MSGGASPKCECEIVHTRFVGGVLCPHRVIPASTSIRAVSYTMAMAGILWLLVRALRSAPGCKCSHRCSAAPSSSHTFLCLAFSLSQTRPRPHWEIVAFVSPAINLPVIAAIGYRLCVRMAQWHLREGFIVALLLLSWPHLALAQTSASDLAAMQAISSAWCVVKRCTGAVWSPARHEFKISPHLFARFLSQVPPQ